MQEWLNNFHGANAAFPAVEIAVKAAVTLALGLLVGFEREWSNKDVGVRTFAMTAFLGLLSALLDPVSLVLSGGAVLIVIVFVNLRTLQVARKLEATTSIALAIVFLLGVLVGRGHLFTPVSSAILVAMLLALKPQLRAFAGGLKEEEVRSALFLALLGFVIWPLLPDRFIDPWQLIRPREDWVTVVVIACLGFLNYVLLRVYGSRGIYLTAILGGLVNSTATVAELAGTLSAAGLIEWITPVALLTSVSMFLRNAVILAIFTRAALLTAAGPLIAMGLVSAYWVYRDRLQAALIERNVSLQLGSPLSLAKIAKLASLFLAVQIVAALGQRLMGNAGFQVVSAIGGLFSSAGTTGAAVSMAMHGKVSDAQAGIAVVLTSIASALVNIPIIAREAKARPALRPLIIRSMAQAGCGVIVLVLQAQLG